MAVNHFGCHDMDPFSDHVNDATYQLKKFKNSFLKEKYTAIG